MWPLALIGASRLFLLFIFMSIPNKDAQNSKVIAILGATGKQGCAVIKAFHSLCGDPSQYKLRAITRDANSRRSQSLMSSGLVDEIFQADVTQEKSLLRAFEGCYGAFVVSDNKLETGYAAKEMAALRNVKRALLRSPSIEHVVFSTSTDTRPYISKAETVNSWKILDEKSRMFVPHMDGKSEIGLEFIAELPTTLLLTSFYTDNFIHFGMGPSRTDKDSPYGITFPMANEKLVMVTVEDIGKCACAIFQEGKSYIGKHIGVSSDVLTGNEIAEIFTKVCGQKVQYNNVPTDVYATFFPGAQDLANMFRFYVEFADIYVKSRTIPKKLLNRMGGVTSLEEYLIKNKNFFNL